MPILRLLRPRRAGSRRPRTRLIALAGLVVTAAVALVAVLLTGRTTATATTGSADTATVERGTVTQTVSAAGTVQAAGTRGLSFSTTGTVTELNAKAGDPVTAGQVLAKIDDSDAQAAVDTAQTAVDTAQTALANAQATASATPTTSCQPATGQQSQQGGAGSACTTGGANPGSGSNRASGGGTDSLMSAQQQLNNAELTLSQAQQRLAGTVITAPITGRVLTATGAVGATETPGSTPFISLGALTDTEVAASFTETDVASLAIGQTASITLPDRGTQTYTGKVSQVSPAGTTSNQLVRYSVLIAFDQAPTDLLYGQSATVTVTTQSATGVLYVPSTAVTDIRDSTGTVTVNSAGGEQRLTVQIGLRGDRYTEIRSGLSQGQTVLVGAS
jgi:multidrug efflux pump subunit AcrA (membrane-fusion protein)